MTRSSQPTRLPSDIYESASIAARVASRTVPQQIAHWARIGRQLEMAPDVSQRQISRVLAGSGCYDALDEQEQAIVREEWAARVQAKRAALDYAEELSAAGETYSELDENGDLVIRPAR